MTNPPRFEILRRISRRTGQCSWSIFDNHAYSEVYIANCLQDAIDEKARLEMPPARWSYKTQGGIGFISNED